MMTNEQFEKELQKLAIPAALQELRDAADADLIDGRMITFDAWYNNLTA